MHASISMFQGATLQEAIATVLEGEATRMIHHDRRALGQSMQLSRQRQRARDESPSYIHWAEGTMSLLVVQGKQSS